MTPKEPLFTKAGLERAGMRIPDVKFHGEIQAFARTDRERPPRPGGILFVGDSDIRFWNDDGCFEEAFADLNAINRGFGGARTWETLIYFPRIIAPYRPDLIVYNAGDNDIAALKSAGPDTAEIGVRLFLRMVRKHLPETRRVFYLAIHPAPCNEPLWRHQREANRRIRARCEACDFAEYLDYLALIVTATGSLRRSVFRADRLHYTPAFYRVLAAYVRPILTAR